MTNSTSTLERGRGVPLPGFQHIQRVLRPASEVPWAKVLPGEFYVSCLNEEIVTVLGSCISVCMWDKEAGIGGMNHFLLPEPPQQQAASPRYGIWAMKHLLDTLSSYGARTGSLEVKVTGGGNIGMEGCQVANNNIAFIDQYLEQLGLKPVVRDVGGPHPRKVRFHPLTGRLRVFKLPALTSEIAPELESAEWAIPRDALQKQRKKK
jgi:chemotaxis protein CheD